MTEDDRGFLRAILTDPDDPTHRLVYADWLEERGDPRGEFLRLELQIAALPAEDKKRAPLAKRLDELRGTVDPNWLALLDRPKIENCSLHFAFRCPKKWEKLKLTDDQTVRYCTTCKKQVHYCDSVNEAYTHATLGHCVAVDTRVPRTPGDLDPPRPRMTMGLLMPLPRQEPADEDSPERPQPRRPRRPPYRRRRRGRK
jgi:uncharacterized protein (TIGR02996 family)